LPALATRARALYVSRSMADVLFVSKALAPPWNDSGKNLVHDLARGLLRHRPTVMVGPDRALELARARKLQVYAGSVGFAPALLDQVRVFAHLLGSRQHALWHFFFAPNARSCRAGWAATRLRNKRSVHTLSSAPRDPRAIVPLLFADTNVVLSCHTERRLREAGLSPSRLVRIAPAIEPLAPRTPAQQRRLRAELGLPASAPIVVYPGDLEFGEGAPLMLEAARALSGDTRLIMACRTKTLSARVAERTFRARCASLGLSQRVQFVGETARIHDLLACADVVALPSVDLYAKMDYPLVLLEAMSLARSVIVARGSAAEELCQGSAAIALDPRADALAEGIAQLLDDRSQRDQLGARAAESVRTRYCYTVMAARYEQLYDSLLGGPT
jgi:glycosyltransferase involved in cell wall biosynthesis